MSANFGLLVPQIVDYWVRNSWISSGQAGPGGWQLVSRALDNLVAEDLLPSFPAVMVVGPRGTGNSTTLSQYADTALDLSIPAVRTAVAEDPDGVIDGARGVVSVDEWHELPEILGAIKRSVDQLGGRQTGRIIITGSVRARRQAAAWPGTGRFIRVRMYGLTQSELGFRSSMDPEDWPGFSEAVGSVTWSIAPLFDDFATRFVKAEMSLAGHLATAIDHLLGEDAHAIALDWRHPGYRFFPRQSELPTLQNSWPIPVLPDGDYFLYLAVDLRFG